VGEFHGSQFITRHTKVFDNVKEAVWFPLTGIPASATEF
jgi:hypothetical protein